MHRYVLSSAALAVSVIALFVALSGTGVASGRVEQSRTTASGPIARSFLVMKKGVGTTPKNVHKGARIRIGHFGKRRTSSIIEVIWTGHVSAVSGDPLEACSFQLQVDRRTADGYGGNAIVGGTRRRGGGVPVGVSAFFRSLDRGGHALNVVIRATGDARGDSCYMDPGNWHESFVVEEWSSPS